MNAATLSAITTLIYNIVVIAGILGALFAFRGGRNKAVDDTQAKLIAMYQAEIEVQGRRITELEKEGAVQKQNMSLIRKALKQRGLLVTIDGDLVTISNEGGVILTQHGSVQPNEP
jgi:hypothetical protein